MVTMSALANLKIQKHAKKMIAAAAKTAATIKTAAKMITMIPLAETMPSTIVITAKRTGALETLAQARAIPLEGASFIESVTILQTMEASLFLSETVN